MGFIVLLHEASQIRTRQMRVVLHVIACGVPVLGRLTMALKNGKGALLSFRFSSIIRESSPACAIHQAFGRLLFDTRFWTPALLHLLVKT